MSLLDEVLDAHGGLAAHRAATEIRARVRSGGFAFASRFTGRALRDLRGTVSAREPHTVLEPYPAAGRRGVFTPEEVRVEDAAGALVAARSHPRAAFRSPRHALWWDDLDTLYFAGYALWNYLNAPFLFAADGFEVREDGPRTLAVRFPAGVPTHSTEQRFTYDDGLRLVRHDYTAEPFGRWARAVHLCRAHARAGGLLFGTSRRVYPRGPRGRPVPLPTLVWIELEDLSVS